MAIVNASLRFRVLWKAAVDRSRLPSGDLPTLDPMPTSALPACRFLQNHRCRTLTGSAANVTVAICSHRHAACSYLGANSAGWPTMRGWRGGWRRVCSSLLIFCKACSGMGQRRTVSGTQLAGSRHACMTDTLMFAGAATWERDCGSSGKCHPSCWVVAVRPGT